MAFVDGKLVAPEVSADRVEHTEDGIKIGVVDFLITQKKRGIWMATAFIPTPDGEGMLKAPRHDGWLETSKEAIISSIKEDWPVFWNDQWLGMQIPEIHMNRLDVEIVDLKDQLKDAEAERALWQNEHLSSTNQ